MLYLKSPDEIEMLFEAGQVVARAHDLLASMIEPGISTEELDKVAEDFFLKNKSKPAFKGYMGYPASICASVNEVIVHGIPSKKIKLKEGDIISIDLGAVLNGWVGDAARTWEVGKVSKKAHDLIEATKASLYQGIDQMVAGNRLGDIGYAVQSWVEPKGFSVVRQFVGHGIGRKMHEEPQVPNYGRKGTGLRLREGMVLAVEPMINEGTYELEVLDDNWTAVTKDGKLSAHWEHTIAITKNGPRILTGE